MMGLFRRKAPAPIVAAPAMRAFAAGLDIQDQTKIDHALYRLDAIARHCEQTAHAVDPVVAEEFRSEAAVHAVNLVQSKAMTRAEADAAIARIEAALTVAGV